MRLARIVPILLPLAMVGASAFAQNVPGGLLPGQIEKQFREPPTPRPAPLAQPSSPPPVSSVPAGAESVRFRLERVELEGLDFVPAGRFDSMLRVEAGKEISIVDLYALADRLTARLRADGYLLARVIVPPQDIADGVARLRVIRGHVAAVRIVGDVGEGAARIGNYAERIRATKPLTATALERYMLLINDLPGVFATATLSPSRLEAGAADLEVRVQRRKWSAGVSVDNRGGGYLGDWRVIADAAVADLLREGQNSSIKVVASPGGELAYLAAQHEEPIGGEGGRLGISLTATRAEPDERTFIPLNLETRSQALGLTYSHPLRRGRHDNLGVRAGLSLHNGEESVFGIRDRQDKLRSLRLGATWDAVDAWRGTNLVDVELSRGLSGLGASGNGDPMLTRADGKVDYSKFALFAARVQDFSANWSLLAALSGQYAFDNLLASELFGFGGEPFGRGYDPSELVGDHGLAFKAELRWRGLAPVAGGMPIRVHGFYDIGRVWRRDAMPADARDSAASIGLGARVEVKRDVSLSIEVAKPLTRDVASEGDRSPRLYVGLSARM